MTAHQSPMKYRSFWRHFSYGSDRFSVCDQPAARGIDNVKHEIGVGTHVYRDETFVEKQISTDIQSTVSPDDRTDGFKTKVQVNAQARDTRLRAGQKKDLLLGHAKLITKTYSLSINQGVGVGRNLSLGIGGDQNEASRSSFWTLGLFPLVSDDTIETGVSYRDTRRNQPKRDFTDTDGRRIITTDRLAGKQISLFTRAYLTPSTMMRVDYSNSSQTDRPRAWSLSNEWRQYIADLNGAAHATFSHYENVGTITTKTSYGSIVAQSIQLSWNQKFATNTIIIPTYRAYVEKEKTTRQRRRSQSSIFPLSQLEVKQRFGKGSTPI